MYSAPYYLTARFVFFAKEGPHHKAYDIMVSGKTRREAFIKIREKFEQLNFIGSLNLTKTKKTIN